MPAWLDKVVEDAFTNLIGAGTPGVIDSIRYLHSRGVHQASIFHHKIGFVDPSFVLQEGTQEFIDWAGKYLCDCLTFPIYSLTGDVIGLQIRSMRDDFTTRPYKQFYHYHRDLHPYMYGLKQALPHIYSTQTVIIVEGIFDYHAVQTYAPNTVAVMTSGVPNPCKRFFRRFVTRVICLLDMDEAGRDGAQRLQAGAKGYSVLVPEYSEKDPDSLRQNGKIPELTRLCSLGINSIPR